MGAVGRQDAKCEIGIRIVVICRHISSWAGTKLSASASAAVEGESQG